MIRAVVLCFLSLPCSNCIRTMVVDLSNTTVSADIKGETTGKKWITKKVGIYCNEDERLELTGGLPKGEALEEESNLKAEEVLFTLVTVEHCGRLALANEGCEDSPYQIYTNIEDTVHGKGCPKDKCKCRCVKKGKTCTINEQRWHAENILFEYEEPPAKLTPGDVCEGGPRGSGYDERCPAAHACCRKGYRSNCFLGGCDVEECENIKPDYEWKHQDKHECVPLIPTAVVVRNEDPLKVMPILRDGDKTYKMTDSGKLGADLAPTDVPDNLKGMVWMDQIGYYAYSQVPTANAAPDALVCFGDKHFPLREVPGEGQGSGKYGQNIELRRGRIDVKTDGPCWTWFNEGRGLSKARHLKDTFGYHYEFYWTTDPDLPYPPHNHVKINAAWDRFGFQPPSFGLLKASMYTQEVSDWCSQCASEGKYIDPPTTDEEQMCGCEGGGGCTSDDDGEEDLQDKEGRKYKRPAMKATILEANVLACKCHNKPIIAHMCAKWARKTVVAGSVMFYYAFEVINGAGQHVEPGWSKYLEWTNKISTPDEGIAFKRGWVPDLNDGPDFSTPNTQFVGIRHDEDVTSLA